MASGVGDLKMRTPGSTALGPSLAKNLERWRQGRLIENDKVAGNVRPFTHRNDDAECDRRSKTQEICHKTWLSASLLSAHRLVENRLLFQGQKCLRPD
jgi:hypothetical protein